MTARRAVAVRENAATLPPQRGRRPRIAGEVSTVRIWAFLTTSERRALRRVAKENHQTIAQVIREAVNEYVSDYADRKVFTATHNSGRPSS